jgi:tRNA threonylcarbamoyladenosine biosynthesis protein TsaE
MQSRSVSPDELRAHAAAFIAQLRPGFVATIVTLSGVLGAGKTTFAQGVAEALGVGEMVTSPTFVIEKKYELPRETAGGFARLIHIDAYRLADARELEALGWKEIAADPANLILLEWPERVPELMVEGAIHVRIDIDGDGRIIIN